MSGSDKILVEVDVELVDLIPNYLAKREADVKQILEWIEQSAFDNIRELAHKIKGSGGGYGFAGLSQIAAELEQAAKDSNLEAIKNGLSDIQHYLENIEITYVEI